MELPDTTSHTPGGLQYPTTLPPPLPPPHSPFLQTQGHNDTNIYALITKYYVLSVILRVMLQRSNEMASVCGRGSKDRDGCLVAVPSAFRLLSIVGGEVWVSFLFT